MIVRSFAAAVLLSGALLGPAAAEPPARPADPVTEANETCLGCHSDPGLSLTLGDGTVRSLTVDPNHLARSVHGGELRCTECHAGMDDVPHPEKAFADAHALRAEMGESCKTCHQKDAAHAKDGMHEKLRAAGDRRAPTCVDCHGSHDVARPHMPRSRISSTCARCHPAVFEKYAASVHGRALIEQRNQDVPTCTDCHRSHDIEDPRTAEWKLKIPEMCGRCHADEKLAAKYGMSPAVLRTYLADFHGVTASLHRGEDDAGKGGAVTAVCTDCHGVHDIAHPGLPGSTTHANLTNACAKCHPGATPEFPAAWLSHYEPSWTKAPLVHAVRLAYRILIPVVLGGLLLQILIHLRRFAMAMAR
jgi:predicted CXXCH cytochrome family protein